ncbi:MAG: ABC transporter ATP-binding protein [Planctomycetia bacterium]
MGAPIISVEGVGKRYRLQHQATGSYATLRDSLTALVRGATGAGGMHAATSEDFWALRDVSFQVQRGDVIGIIGRNGAGKSTLLKILSRITEPTTGTIRLRGRVASLLEVGTGFHPELTGRENIFLNGAILGMTKAEIRSRFAQIVEFAEVSRFLDTPVKHYSSGMYVRLAFAVAAHLEPEILVVDEVLAVGDAEFQQKCLRKMKDVAGHGRTVLFVSHNMMAVRRLCTHAVLLNRGTVAASGRVADIVDAYLDGCQQAAGGATQEFLGREAPAQPAFARVTIVNAAGQPRATVLAGEPFCITMDVTNPFDEPFAGTVGVEVLDTDGVSLFTSHSDDVSREVTLLPPGTTTLTCVVDPNPLMPGRYTLQLGLVDRHWVRQDIVIPDISLHVDHLPYAGDHMSLQRPGRLLVKLPWTVADRVPTPVRS